MLRYPRRIESLLRYQDMHALQLLFPLAVKCPTEKKKSKKERRKKKKKRKKSSTKSLELILRAYTVAFSLQKVTSSHLLLVDLMKN